jgi:hypothetical protein
MRLSLLGTSKLGSLAGVGVPTNMALGNFNSMVSVSPAGKAAAGGVAAVSSFFPQELSPSARMIGSDIGLSFIGKILLFKDW